MGALGHGLGEPRNFPRLPPLRALTRSQPSGRVAALRDDLAVLVADAPDYVPRVIATLPTGGEACGDLEEASVADLRLSPDGRRLLVSLWRVPEEDLAGEAQGDDAKQALVLLDVETGSILRSLPASRARRVLTVARDATRVLPGARTCACSSWSPARSTRPGRRRPGRTTGPLAAVPGPEDHQATVLLAADAWARRESEDPDTRVVVLDLEQPARRRRRAGPAPGPTRWSRTPPAALRGTGWTPTMPAASTAPRRATKITERHPVQGAPDEELLMGGGVFAFGERLLAPKGPSTGGAPPGFGGRRLALTLRPTRLRPGGPRRAPPGQRPPPAGGCSPGETATASP